MDQCRTCLTEGLLSNIFGTHGSVMISTTIMSITKIEIKPDDNLPSTICSDCIAKLDSCIEFIDLCKSSDDKLRSIKKTEIHTNNYIEMNNDSPLDNCGMSPKSDLPNDLMIDERNICDTFKDLHDNTSENECKDMRVDKCEKKRTGKKAQKQQCFTCGKVMSSRFRLKTHLRTHTGERPYSCPHCNKNFSLTQNLKVHLRVHTGEKPLQCTICGESFAQSAGLVAHKRKHSGQTPYNCVLCPRSFRTVGHLQYHLRRHTGEKNFECNTCNRAFITRSDLKQHLLTHSGERPHVCCICGLRLTRSSHLKRHIQHIHNGQKPFICSLCPAKFTEKNGFEKHKRTHIEQKNVDISACTKTVM